MPRQEVGREAAAAAGELPQETAEAGAAAELDRVEAEIRRSEEAEAAQGIPEEVSPGEEAGPARRRGRPRKSEQQAAPVSVGDGHAARADREVQCCPAGHEAQRGFSFCPVCGVAMTGQAPAEWRDRNGHLSPPEHNFCAICGAPRSEPMQSMVGAFGASELRPARPTPWNQLTAEEKAQRQAEHAAAVAAGQRDPGITYEQPPAGSETYVVHFVKDGLSFAGQVWLRGQEIELVIGSPRWEEAKSWIRLDDFEQVERFGDVYFRHGPWRGKGYREAAAGPWEKLKDKDGNEIPPPSEDQLAAAEAAERRRGRRVPQPAL